MAIVTGNFYAERGSVVYAGIPLDDYLVENITWSAEIGLNSVDAMTSTFTKGGFVRGNLDVKGSFDLLIPASGAMPAIESQDFQSNQFSIIVTTAANMFGQTTFQGMSWAFGTIAVGGLSGGFSQVGTPGKFSYTFMAITYTPISPTGT